MLFVLQNRTVFWQTIKYFRVKTKYIDINYLEKIPFTLFLSLQIKVFCLTFGRFSVLNFFFGSYIALEVFFQTKKTSNEENHKPYRKVDDEKENLTLNPAIWPQFDLQS